MFYRTILILSCLFLLFYVDVKANNSSIPPLLVITDLRAVGKETAVSETKVFSEFMRMELERTGKFRVLGKSTMLSTLKSRSFSYPCYELQCFIEMGKILKADQVVAGNMRREGDRLEVTVRLIDVEQEELAETIYRVGEDIGEKDLLGEWGRKILSAVFHIHPDQMKPPEENSIEHDEEGNQVSIEEKVKFKYPGMVYIPGGETILGSNEGDVCERPPHRVYVEPFYIGKYEVTNAEYKAFVEATDHRSPPHWSGNTIPHGKENHPVTWVSFEDAAAYCEWKGVRLPTEAEWERAAHGPNMRVYPWGNLFSAKRANTWEAGHKDTIPVGSLPLGDSPYLVKDMAGNAFEWVAGFFQPYPGSQEKLPEYEQHLRVLRGGSWNFNEYYARTTHRFPRSGGERGRTYGFRIARSK